MSSLDDRSVHCCITSPPYYGLRDYGVDGQIGLEPTLAEYIAALVDVFREVRRVLRDDGTLWLNLGDSYTSGGRAARDGDDKLAAREMGVCPVTPTGLKPKDLKMVPARVAIALQDDGWYLRSDIIWAKTNPMPESVTDRPTSAHEHVFLLTKSPRYYYDADAIREPNSSPEQFEHNVKYAKTYDAYDDRAGATGQPGNVNNVGIHSRAGKQAGHGRRHAGFNARWDAAEANGGVLPGRNKRNVWTISTTPYPGAHFATFPPKLVEPMILAGCPEGGTVLDPFLGSGTTLMVADWRGRNGVGVELNRGYAEMAKNRICSKGTMFTAVEVVP